VQDVAFRLLLGSCLCAAAALTGIAGPPEDRHTPGDSADKINFEGMAKVVDLCEDVLDRLLVASRPVFVPPPTRKSLKGSN
jgi:hypothetical protein